MPRKERRSRKTYGDFARKQDAGARPVGLGDDPDFRATLPDRVGVQDPEALADAQAVLAGILKRNLAPIAGGVATRGEAIPLSEGPEEWVESLIGVVETRPVAEEIVDAFAAVTSERISETSVSDRGLTAVVREKETVPEEPADPSPVRDCLLTLAVGLTLIWGAAEAIPMARRSARLEAETVRELLGTPYRRSSQNNPSTYSGE